MEGYDGGGGGGTLISIHTMENLQDFTTTLHKQANSWNGWPIL
jgi:hypothetical protein